MGFRWNSPLAQVLAVGIICFCCPGMYNSLNSLGAGGQVDSKIGQNANVALNTCFALFGLLAGAIHNKLGPKWTIFIGCTTYCLYAGSFLSYNHHKTGWFSVIAGALLGVGAAMLWTAQGAIMMAYPSEQEKGRYIGYFWATFNAGGVVGSMIPLAINFKSTSTGPLADSIYIAFMAIMALGTFIGLTLSAPSKIVRNNGEKIRIQEFPTWTGEVIATLKLFLDWRMVVLIPMFLSSNWFYAYQFATVQGWFSIRTQSLNNILYWGAQILGSYGFGRILDYQGAPRRTRGLWGLGIITVFFTITWIGGIFFQRTYTIDDPAGNHDFTEGSVYIGPLFLYIFYGFGDAAWQTYCYWLMGALSNDVTVLSRYSGFYKCIQSSGGAISWRINALKVPFMTELIICFALLVASIPGAFFLANRLEEHSEEAVHSSEHHESKLDEKHEIQA
ncbi:major facilitator superfamily domain-containing protein [Linnemannia elongata]|nr:major facilitator superfamily domain-containing protein [Linnemannia elongata]